MGGDANYPAKGRYTTAILMFTQTSCCRVITMHQCATYSTNMEALLQESREVDTMNVPASDYGPTFDIVF